ncbi:hypothetical protein C1646_759361 [Rhizophagus diaphanus]|nr:hypothetical protein C1646_759361 [Rhizophagus diaphanus] [Rhizophagus sp. MUCL 43196]
MSNTNANTSVSNSSSIVNDVRQKISESLVIDSGPLIKGINVRDKHSCDFLNQISFDLQIKVPSDEALKEDLRVLALTYMLEVEANGTKRLRKETVKYLRNLVEQQQRIDEPNLVSNLESLKLTDITAEFSSSEGTDHQRDADEPIVEISTHNAERYNTSILVSDQNSINQKRNEISDTHQDEEYDDDYIGWIAPDNIDDYQAKEHE